MIICADDYGLREDIDRAILGLCDLGKLSAVSCMVLFERCDIGTLKCLLAHESKVDIGLHLCLTDERLPLSLPSLESNLPDFKSLFARAFSGQIKLEEIFRQISIQYELFIKKCGRPPDYVDGHLHAHQLPGVRQALVEFIGSLRSECRPYVRNTETSVNELRRRKLPWIKAAFIDAFGARTQRVLRSNALPTNDGFAGIYDFKKWRNYSGYLPKFIDCLRQPNGILVVHPGFNEDWRRQEFESLKKIIFDKQPNRFERRAF